MDDIKQQMLKDMVADMNPEDYEHVLGFLKDRVARLDVPERDQGGPKDTAVQRLAADRLRWLRDPAHRRLDNRRFDPDEAVSMDKIAEMVRVSRPRVHKLLEVLTPDLVQTRTRRTG